MAEPTDLTSPITYGSTPSSVYSDYEVRQQGLKEARPIFDESQIIESQTKIDTTAPTPSFLQLQLEILPNPRDTDPGTPKGFATNTLFTREAVMRQFGPASHQEALLDKLAQLALETTSPQEEKQIEHTTRFVETLQSLNLISQMVFQEQDRIGKA
ncbi:MAG: hypothetical protein K940chlam8_01025 [Chlamydiae bacterium]|nr:hypothetical protein [Chlamydiota bacterium]